MSRSRAALPKRARNPPSARRISIFSTSVSRSLVGVGQRGSADASADAHMVELSLQRAKAGFDVAKTLAIGGLCKGHAQKLIQAGELLDLVVAAIACDALSERMHGQEVHQLTEHGASDIYWPSPSNGATRNGRSLR